ncbi:hypothetical protein OC846_006730 [Tilletia horrida]|uniref:Integrase catalytic domain-containing protein n=1 Tax=Tilletia horrida TaxID=155126 RepID=A0AAN6GI78_9BASI|nr:hypothetical protein OC846_006730 [Tilletia horrida]
MPDLCQAITNLRSLSTGEAGERCLIGALRGVGICISRAKVREAVRILDPFPVPQRWRTTLQRRVYYVPFVNSLWHLDGHHKMIRWRIVIHGCIDGKSRLVTFLRAHGDNTAQSVARAFDNAVTKWGLPSRVRADYGGENLGVKARMEAQRGIGRASFIKGSSTHNQRIERLWVDLQRLTTAKYKAVFEHLEAQRLLDVTNPVHLWALHFTFLPQLNRALDHFSDMWNHHPIRTPGLLNRSPMQLRAEGLLDAQRRGVDILGAGSVDDHAILQEGLRDFAEYGIETTGQPRDPLPSDPHVHIDAIDHLIPASLRSPALQVEWRRALAPSWPPAADFGIGRYATLLGLIRQHLDREFT